jgi:hypothetical protein
MWVSSGATVMMEAVTFTNNRIPVENTDSAVIRVNAEDSSESLAQPQDTMIIMELCDFTESNTAANLIVTSKDNESSLEHASRVYSDRNFEVLQISGQVNKVGSAKPLLQAPADRLGVNGTSAWLLRVQVCSSSTSSPCHVMSAFSCAVSHSFARATIQGETYVLLMIIAKHG